MKLRFKLGNVEIEELGIKLGGVEIETECSLEETTGVYELQKKAIKDLPGILEDLKAGADKFEEISDKSDILNEVRIANEYRTICEVSSNFEEEFPTSSDNMIQVNGVLADIQGFFRRKKQEALNKRFELNK